MERVAMGTDIWRYVFDAVEDPIFLHDAEFRVRFANRAYCHEAGFSEAQALGKLYWEVFPLGKGPLPGCEAVAHERNGASSLEEVRAGGKIYLSRGYTVRAESGQPSYSLHILSNITEIKQAQLNLSEQLEELRRWHAVMLGREARILELKQEVNELLAQAGQPPRYASTDNEAISKA